MIWGGLIVFNDDLEDIHIWPIDLPHRRTQSQQSASYGINLRWYNNQNVKMFLFLGKDSNSPK